MFSIGEMNVFSEENAKKNWVVSINGQTSLKNIAKIITFIEIQMSYNHFQGRVGHTVCICYAFSSSGRFIQFFYEAIVDAFINFVHAMHMTFSDCNT